jgi:hypothetical protein
MSKADAEQIQAESATIESALVELVRGGVPVDDVRTLDVVDRHYQWMCHFWTPDRDAYACIGNMYVDDARFAAYYDGKQDGLAVYLRDAINAYATARL